MDQVQELGRSAQHVFLLLSDQLRRVDPVILVCTTLGAGYVLSQLQTIHQSDIGIKERVLRTVFRWVRAIPAVRDRVRKEIDNVRTELHSSIHHSDDATYSFRELPKEGIRREELEQIAQHYSDMEGPAYLDGRVSGAVFSDESDRDEAAIYGFVCEKFAWSNPLWPKLFPGVRKMEAEVVRMCCDMLHGGESACGTMSTGGTISILLACLAHRNRALSQGVLFPEMIVPITAHAAFTKAAEVFRIKLIRIPVDPVTYKVDLKKMRAAVTRRTAMLVGSAPNFPYGTIDDIEQIARIGLDYDIPVHVDACLGGFLLPFMDDAPAFDFRVPGVSSISADTHKYGLTPKGSSVVLYSSKEYLHHQYFCDTLWPGGIYASATLEGSRAGLNIALCWTSLLFHGQSAYREKTKAVVDTTRRIRDGIESIPELRLQGASDTCIVSWTSDQIDIHRFSDLMSRRGWQLTNLQFPSGVHIMVTANHAKDGVAEAFIRDARLVVDEIRATPNAKPEGQAALYGMSQKIPDRSIVRDFASVYLDECYAMPS